MHLRIVPILSRMLKLGTHKNSNHPLVVSLQGVSLIIWKTWPHPVEERISEIGDCMLTSALDRYFLF